MEGYRDTGKQKTRWKMNLIEDEQGRGPNSVNRCNKSIRRRRRKRRIS
jgi:hypothetical protein